MTQCITEQYFGGPQAFYAKLVLLGLLRKDCPVCHRLISFQFVADRNFPKTYCHNCSSKVTSCRKNSVFGLFDIKKNAAFLFILQSFVMGASMQLMTNLSGLGPLTTRTYVNIIRTIMVDEAERMYEQWEGDLGGPGKVIEIDEVFVVKRKYNVGKRLVKEELVIFGITELEGGAVQILDDELYDYLVQKEDYKEQKALQRKRQQQRRRGGAGIFSSDETARCDQPSQTTNGPIGLAGVTSGGPVVFSFNPDMEKKERELFGPSVKSRPRRTLFFIVPDRRRETLLDIIYK